MPFRCGCGIVRARRSRPGLRPACAPRDASAASIPRSPRSSTRSSTASRRRSGGSWSTHHAVIDGWSMGIFLRDVAASTPTTRRSPSGPRVPSLRRVGHGLDVRPPRTSGAAPSSGSPHRARSRSVGPSAARSCARTGWSRPSFIGEPKATARPAGDHQRDLPRRRGAGYARRTGGARPALHAGRAEAELHRRRRSHGRGLHRDGAHPDRMDATRDGRGWYARCNSSRSTSRVTRTWL